MKSVLNYKYPVAFFINGIGDSILILPTLRALTFLFPHRLTLICDKAAGETWFSDLPLFQLIKLNVQHGKDGKKFETREISIMVENCELFLSLVPWRNQNLLSLLKTLNPRLSIGFFPEFDIEIPLDYNKHTADLSFDIVSYFDRSLRLEDFSSPPKLPSSSNNFARKLRSKILEPYKVLAVHADTLPEKMWSNDLFVQLLNSFLEKHVDFVAILIGATYQPLDKGKNNSRIIPCYGLPLQTSCALVSMADLFVGVDSSMLHLADFYRIPSIGLFGPTNSEEFGFRLGPHFHICGNGTMNNIKVDEVLEKIERLLELKTPDINNLHREESLNERFSTNYFPIWENHLFINLPKKEKNRVLNSYEFAKNATLQYGIDDATIKHSGGFDFINVLYKVESKNQKYALRVMHPKCNYAIIKSQLDWMFHLQNDTKIRVPNPLKSSNGKYLEKLKIKNISETCYCYIYDWIEGKTIYNARTKDLQEEVIENFGIYVGNLHRYSKSFNVPHWFFLPKYDSIVLERFLLYLSENENYSINQKNDLTLNIEAGKILLDTMKELGKTKDMFGIIHGDLGPRNVLVLRDEKICAIDFQDCSFGYYLSEIEKILSDTLLEAEHEAFLRGYQQVESLPTNFFSLLKIFKQARKGLKWMPDSTFIIR